MHFHPTQQNLFWSSIAVFALRIKKIQQSHLNHPIYFTSTILCIYPSGAPRSLHSLSAGHAILHVAVASPGAIRRRAGIVRRRLCDRGRVLPRVAGRILYLHRGMAGLMGRQ